MAEVTGDIGGSSVQLNNAATESTLRELLAAINSMSAKMGGSGAGAAGVDKLSKEAIKAAQAGHRFGREMDRLEDGAGRLKDEFDDAQDSLESFNAKANMAKNALGTLSKGLIGAVGIIGNVAGTVSQLGNSFSGVADAFSQLPLGIGDVVGAVFKPVAAAAESSYKAFTTGASVGANFNGSVSQMIRSASEAGLTIDDYSTIISQSGEALRYLGGSTEDGAKNMARLTGILRKGEQGFGTLNAQLANLGYTTADTAKAMATQARHNAILNRGRQLSDKELIASTGSYLKSLDAVSKLTGKSKEALESELEQRMTDAQFQVATRGMQAEDAKRLSLYMSTLGPEMGDAFKEMIARGNLSGEATQKLMETNPQLAREMLAAAKQTKASGQFTADGMAALDAQVVSHSKAMVDNQKVVTQATYMTDRYGQVYVDQTLAASRNADDLRKINESVSKVPDTLKDGSDRMGASFKTAQETIAQESNKMLATLVESDAFDQMIDAYKAAATFINEHMGDALKLVTDNLKELALAAAGLSAATMLLSGVQGFKGLRSAIAGFKSTKAAAAAAKTAPKVAGAGTSRVTSAAGVADDVAGAATKGATSAADDVARAAANSVDDVARAGSNVAGALNKTVKVLGPVATVAAGVYEGYTGFTDAEAKLQAGEITEKQANIEKTEAIAGAAGGAAGGWGGASAGAALGTLILPGVGTVVGGIVGGLAGYFAGSEGAKAISGPIADALTGPDTLKDLENKAAKLRETIAEGTGITNWSIEDEQAELAELQKQIERIKLEQLKAEARQNSSPVVNPNAPKMSPVDSEVKKLQAEKEAAQKEKEKLEKEKQEQEELSKDDHLGASLQKDQTTLLTKLNSNIEELVRLANTQLTVDKQQLSAIQGNSMDLFSTV